MNQTDFTRGPYGEIFAPVLLAGLDDEDTLAILEQDSAAGGHPIASMPSRGDSRAGMLILGRMYVHQKNLKRALAGQMNDDPDAAALYKAVTQRGELLSLRPVGMEGLHFSTFAPVLKRLEGDHWRVGMQGQGRSAEIEGRPDEVFDQAAALYVQWCDEEKGRFEATVSKLLQAVPHSINHDVWAVAIRQAQSVTPRQSVPIAESVTLYPGRHSIYLLATAKGQRPIEASSPDRAARIAEAVARQTKSNVMYPTAVHALHALMIAGEWDSLDREGTKLTFEGKEDNKAVAQWKPQNSQLGLLAVGVRKGRLSLGKGGIEVYLFDSVGKPVLIAKADLCPNVKDWLKTDDGRQAVMAWAVLKLASAKSAKRRSS